MTHELVIDLRSDTVTRPTPAMRDAMAEAIVGDDQYGEDPTANLLEDRAAALMGKEAAVYVASGIMGNLTSLLVHCGRGQEAIVGDGSHILGGEHNGAQTFGGITLVAVPNQADGSIDPEVVRAAIRPRAIAGVQTGVVCLENTHNKCGGVVVSLGAMRAVADVAHEHNLPVHLDGARVFNAAAALGVPVSAIAAEVDTVQFCLSKGLGAPVGSIVAGPANFVDQVRHQRKVLGGAMRQSGVIAAAGLVALEQMVERLPEDHRRARTLAEGLANIEGVQIDLDRVQSNLVLFQLAGITDHAPFVAGLGAAGVRAANFYTRGVRMVTHYEITDEDIALTLERVARVVPQFAQAGA